MITAKSYYDKQKLTKVNKKIGKGTIIFSSVLSVLMLGIGVFNIIGAFSGESVGWFYLVMGALVTILSPYPLVNGLKAYRSATKKNLELLGEEQSGLIIEYAFKEKRIEIKTTQNGNTTNDVIMLKYIDRVSPTKDGLAIYLLNGKMYYILDEDIIGGTKSNLLALFTRGGIPIKKQ